MSDPEKALKEPEEEALTDQGNETDRDKTVKDKRKYNLGICLFVVLNALLISLIGITAHNVCSEKNVVVAHDANMCVPCEDLRLHPDDIIEGIERRGENKTICCVPEKDGPDALFENYIDHWLKMKLATGTDRQFVRYKCFDEDSIEPRKPIIKLIGKHEKQPGEHHKLLWDGDHEMAIVPDDGSITHHIEHGFIEIKRSGLYFVYSQIVFEHDTSTEIIQNASDIYMHLVILIKAETSRYASPREVNLMKTSNSHCESQTNRQTITSYLGGASELTEGDKLAVKVYYIIEIVHVPHMNFFGAYML